MREVGDEQYVMNEPVFLGQAAVGVDEESYLRKREEGDSERQNDVQQAYLPSEGGVRRADEEVRVFVVCEEREIAG